MHTDCRSGAVAVDSATSGVELSVEPSLRTAEFFAGVGLVRAAVERCGGEVVFANDVSPMKQELYTANFGGEHYLLRDIRLVRGDDVPNVELCTASFPCTDLSLAGGRAGLAGARSGLFWEFIRIIREMGPRKPNGILIENVTGFITSSGGADLEVAIGALNSLGYLCELAVVDGRWFTGQSRPRLFIACTSGKRRTRVAQWQGGVHPRRLREFIESRWNSLRVAPAVLADLPSEQGRFAEVACNLARSDSAWWQKGRVDAFIDSMSPTQLSRLESMRDADRISWATAYRRTRHGIPRWEMRADELSGCLRTTRGGSSKQAVVRAGLGVVQVRWMTAREYCRLQGADDWKFGSVSDNQVMYAMGDAVCVPAVQWLVQQFAPTWGRNAE